MYVINGSASVPRTVSASSHIELNEDGVAGYTGGLSTFTFRPRNPEFRANAANGGLGGTAAARVASITELTIHIGGSRLLVRTGGQNETGYSFTVATDGTIVVTIPTGDRPATGDSGGDFELFYNRTQYTFTDPNGRRNFAADRCHWSTATAHDGTGYIVHTAAFYDGTNATGVTIDDPIFGYIGKSGRFVAMTDEE